MTTKRHGLGRSGSDHPENTYRIQHMPSAASEGGRNDESHLRIRPVRSVYTPGDFLQWRENQTLNLTPKFQRRGVWKTPARSYFIDTLLRGMPVPPIYFRLVQGADRTHQIREVVDGQQRIAAVLDYIDGKYRLARTLQANWSGQLFGQLGPEQQDRVTSFTFSTEIFQGISDKEVLEIFARLNTYSVPLTAQELRNGKFFGLFKQAAYCLALEHLEFWRRHRVFTEQNIARMMEVELTSELLIAGIAGMQDKKKSIDEFYLQHDELYSSRARDEQRFRNTIDEIVATFNGDLADTEFRRPPFFYTLYCVVHHYLFGLPNEHRLSPKKRLTNDNRLRLHEAVMHLSEIISTAREEDGVPRPYVGFVAACLSQTDNIKPRRTRFEYLFDEAFKPA